MRHRRTCPDPATGDGRPGNFNTERDILPARDARGWVLSVAHLDVVRPGQLEGHRSAEVRLAPVRTESGRAEPSLLELPDGQTRLAFDHELIVAAALDELRRRYAERPDPYWLLDDAFTIRELRILHEAIAGGPLQKDTFRRGMLPHLEPLDAINQGAVGRPARPYRRVGDRPETAR